MKQTTDYSIKAARMIYSTYERIIESIHQLEMLLESSLRLYNLLQRLIDSISRSTSMQYAICVLCFNRSDDCRMLINLINVRNFALRHCKIEGENLQSPRVKVCGNNINKFANVIDADQYLFIHYALWDNSKCSERLSTSISCHFKLTSRSPSHLIQILKVDIQVLALCILHKETPK